MSHKERFKTIQRQRTDIFYSFLGYGNTQENLPSGDDILKKASSIINISEINNLNTSALPTIQEAVNLFEQKCRKNGGPNAFQNAKHAQTEMEKCLKSLINMTELNAEMESAKPKGELDEVFKKYCRRSSILKTCVNNFTTAIEPCLEQKERENKKIILNITESLLNFICYKEGDRIALFIAAGGPDCFQSKQQEIQDCFNTTFGSYIPTANPTTGAMPTLESLPSLIFDDKECTDMNNLQHCIVKELEKCSDPTPGNIVESIFRFIKKVTPCETLLVNVRSAAVTGVQEESSSSIMTSIPTMIAVSFLLQFMHRIFT
ncbi:27 kDa hemolymph protein-like isoform X3 [Vespa mandarinia]|uniref:27 kDa hemolymph protein-like isoform X3 n=1 Tax=Vespa mandarinia TaxID=7446 RepID=UPI0016092D8A|nr:27 kDa hemolymph protein-like isoform X3 [Vespa mandarinia]